MRRKAKAKATLVWCEQCQANMPPDHRDGIAVAQTHVAGVEVH